VVASFLQRTDLPHPAGPWGGAGCIRSGPRGEGEVEEDQPVAASDKTTKLEQARRIWRVARIIQGEKSRPPPAKRRPIPPGGPAPKAA
jgi:hypothetical protein